ncbi:hypothetical protein CT113_08765 [Levilactobacillus brevis]|nr:hypothetical protein CT113_08765 [Levilactobacillus brevis]
MVEAPYWLTSMFYILIGKYDEIVNFLAHSYEFYQFWWFIWLLSNQTLINNNPIINFTIGDRITSHHYP